MHNVVAYFNSIFLMNWYLEQKLMSSILGVRCCSVSLLYFFFQSALTLETNNTSILGLTETSMLLLFTLTDGYRRDVPWQASADDAWLHWPSHSRIYAEGEILIQDLLDIWQRAKFQDAAANSMYHISLSTIRWPVKSCA